MLFDVRIYKVRPGKADAFNKLAREETLPLATSVGHRIAAFGASEADEDTFYLVRSFESGEERTRLLEALYESEVWKHEYDLKVGEMIDQFQTAVIPSGEWWGASRE